MFKRNKKTAENNEAVFSVSNPFLNKLDKKDLRNILVLNVIFLVIIAILIRTKYFYGSTLDWQSQHWAIPQYMREHFYQTGDLFPGFAFNIGGGQNFYNLAYYGYLSPIILFSYLLPFVKMADYIAVTSVLSVMFSVSAFYVWIRRKNSAPMCLLTSVFFLFATPVMFHTHRHVMFINYLPFLMLALMSVDAYFYKKKRGTLILSAFLLVMTSFYFSVSAFVVIMVYGMSLYFRFNRKPDVKSFLVAAVKLGLNLVVSVMMAGILVLPTFFVLLNGRDASQSSLPVLQLLIPKINLGYIEYHTYSMGLTAISLFAVIAGLFSKKNNIRFISAVFAAILCFPIFVFLLNGGQYENAKILIPFIPLACVLLCDLFRRIFEETDELPLIKLSVIFVAVTALGLVFHNGIKAVYYLAPVDTLIVVASLFLYKKFRKKLIVILPSVLTLMTVSYVCAGYDKLVPRSELKAAYNDELSAAVSEILDGDKGLYRFSNAIMPQNTVNIIYDNRYYQSSVYSSVHNKNFSKFYFDGIYNENTYRNAALTTYSNNPLFNMYMGTRYIVSDKPVDVAGYEKLCEKNGYIFYKNENCAPMAYTTDKIMSRAEFESLGYPYREEALMKYVVADKDVSSGFRSETKSLNVDFSGLLSSEYVSETDGGYRISAKEKFSVSVPLDETKTDKIIFVRFTVDNDLPEIEKDKKRDVSVTINGMTNKLTTPGWKYHNNNYSFEYTIGSNESIESLDMEFSKGDYTVTDIRCYELDFDIVRSSVNDLCGFYFDLEKTEGDVIEGEAYCENDGYFQLTVPYDKGFEITVDGVRTDYEMTDTAFVGFPLEKGSHNIRIKFVPPLRNVGIVTTIAGFVIFVTIVVYDKLRKKKK